jgi:hypothetical protein
MLTASQASHNSTLTLSPSIPPKLWTNDHYNNAKYEDIICRPITPTYDVAPDTLIPFLNRLDIRRQDETWKSITFITHDNNTYNLLRHFAKIPITTMISLAADRWKSPTLDINKYTFSHTYNARCLTRLLLAPVSDDFQVTIIGRIDQDLCNDGP